MSKGATIYEPRPGSAISAAMRGAAGTIIDYGAPRRVALLLGLSLVVAASEGLGFVLLVPLLARLSADDAGRAGDLPGALDLPALPLGTLLALFAALVTIRALAELARALAAQALVVRVVDGLRMRAFNGLVGAEWAQLAAMSQSANRAVIVSTIERTGRATQLFTDSLRIGLSLAALGAAALAISPGVAVAAALVALLVTLAHAGLRRRAERLGAALTRHYETIYLRLEQTLDALRLVKSFGRERPVGEAMTAGFAELRAVERAYLRDSGIARAALQAVGAVLLAGLVWLAHTQWLVPLAALLPLVALCIRALPLLGQMQASWQDWRHETPAFAAAHALIAEAESAAEPPPATTAPRLREAIVLNGVSFSHAPGRAGLAPIDARIGARSITAITGPSGAGKSTLADCVGGLLQPTTGRITVDGVPLDGGARIAWRACVAYVQQEPVLFAGSVRDNLLWAHPQASADELVHALERAAAGFVHALPGGIDCDLGAAGRALSGGERQRIALARALLREPDLLILDEATSALDPASEQAIAAALRTIAQTCAVLVISHRGALTALAETEIALGGDAQAPLLNGERA